MTRSDDLVAGYARVYARGDDRVTRRDLERAGEEKNAESMAITILLLLWPGWCRPSKGRLVSGDGGGELPARGAPLESNFAVDSLR